MTDDKIVGIIPTATINRRRGDTKSINMTLTDKDGVAIPITGYTGFLLSVNTEEDPLDATNEVFQLIGTITDGVNGKVSFPITVGDSDNVGEFFYDAQYIDTNSEKFTFIRGSYIMGQDRTKT
jgi:hypothetical protein